MAVQRRNTRQRQLVLDTVRATSEHPTADEIYSAIRKVDEHVSRGTVYRNLNQLSDQQIIRRVGVINGQERFDADTRPHAHFVCNRCGTVLDLPDFPPSRQYIQSLSTQYGFTVEGHESNLRGLCQDCKKIITLEETVS